MQTGRLALCLIDSDNEFQQVAREDGEAAARRAGLSFETHWSFTLHAKPFPALTALRPRRA